MSLRPSSLPMLAQCSQFESGEARDFTDAGTSRHHALSRALKDCNTDWAAGLDADDRDGVEWAAEYIRLHSPSGHDRHIERKLHLLDSDFHEILSGTPDVVCGPELFDLKWRERDYGAQMAAYALMRMQECDCDKINCHVLYAATQQAQRFTFTWDDAAKLVFDIVASTRQPTYHPCDYCGWCAKVVTCPALKKRVQAVQDGREDWKPITMHASEIDATIPSGAGEMGKLLTLARQVAKWCDAVEHHAKTMAEKSGVIPDGFKIQTKTGRKFVTDAVAAFSALNLPQPDFLKCCAVRLNSSKTYTDQVGLTETFAAFHGLKKATAKRDVEKRLADVITTGNSSLSLVAEGNTCPSAISVSSQEK